MMDLHGLLVAEAIEFAKAELKSAKSRRDEVVRFIVGKGLHAEDGVAKIRPALGAFCTKQGLSHSPDPKNNGVLIVRLD
ncbi:Smr protein/MutS2 C-terminal, partial [Lactarius tabidus]